MTAPTSGRPAVSSPIAERRPERLVQHGHARTDDYFWLNRRGDPTVIRHLEAENAYAERMLAPISGLKKRLFAEMKARMPADESSPPYRHGNYFYYQRYEAGKEYPVYCRRPGSLDADEQVLLDVNALAKGHEYFSLRGFTVAPDHRRAAFGVDTRGRRFYTLRFVDLDEGELLSEEIADVSCNFEWANDSRTLLYVRQDRDTQRDYQVLRHVLGGGIDALIHQEDDETNWLYVERSLSGEYLFLVSMSTLSTEVHYLLADRPEESPSLFLPRECEHEYFVIDGADRFFILSNDGAENFKIMQAPLDDTSKSAWTEVVGHRLEVLIDGMEVFEHYVVMSTVERGLDQIEVLDRMSGERYRLEFDEPAYTVYPDDNYEYRSCVLRYTYESMTTPQSTYDVDLRTREHALIKREEVRGGFDPENYASERIFVTARDGASVPVSLVYRLDLGEVGRRPLLLYGYGAYGISMEPGFDANRISLLDRGFVYAIAHVRGGAEMGRGWYLDGRQLNKLNTFHDFIDVARHLIDTGVTSPRHCYASGGSAGGLLIGAVLNMAPELFRGATTHVPFVDVVTTMLDETIPLTTAEWDEWGNPAEQEAYEYMLSYSPYDNVVRQAYPHLLVTTGLNDSLVQYWEPAKWVAKLRRLKADDNLLLLDTDMRAGHTGKTGRYRSLEDIALRYAFLLMLEGVTS